MQNDLVFYIDQYGQCISGGFNGQSFAAVDGDLGKIAFVGPQRVGDSIILNKTGDGIIISADGNGENLILGLRCQFGAVDFNGSACDRGFSREFTACESCIGAVGSFVVDLYGFSGTGKGTVIKGDGFGQMGMDIVVGCAGGLEGTAGKGGSFCKGPVLSCNDAVGIGFGGRTLESSGRFRVTPVKETSIFSAEVVLEVFPRSMITSFASTLSRA